MMHIRQILADGARMAVAVTCAFALSGIGDITVHAALAEPEPSVQAPQSDVGVFAFQHTWNTVAEECEKTYGPSGVGWVQISPPHESITGTEWWTVYQAVSYRLESRFGTEAELAAMVSRCNAVGVGVVADVVVNHTSGHNISWVNDQYGVVGSRYNGSYGRYPAMGLYMYEEGTNDHAYGLPTGDFHSCKKDVADWTDAQEVQECRLTTMWDLNTGSDRVRDVQADYLYRLWKIGVRAFRIDSAKHIAAADLQALKEATVDRINADGSLEQVSDVPFTQEVITHQGEAAGIQPDQYVGVGRVLEFEYAYRLRRMFNGAVADLEHITDGLVGSEHATVFVENWDTARESSETLNSKSGAQYEMANAFMLALGYGEPRIMSDYYVEDVDAGPRGTTDTATPDVDMDSACAAVGAGSRTQGDWLCQPRWTSIKGMLQFHNAAGDAPAGNWQADGDHVVGFDRGELGFFALNNALQERTVSFSTKLPAGRYCNVYAGSCAQPVSVTAGEDGVNRMVVTIPARSAVALDTAALAGEWDGVTGLDPGYEDELDTGVIGVETTRVYYHGQAGEAPVMTATVAGGGAIGEPVTMTLLDGHEGWFVGEVSGANRQVSVLRFDTDRRSYELPLGAVVVTVDGGELVTGRPFPTPGAEPTTKLTVNFHAAGEAQQAAGGVWAWAEDALEEDGWFFAFGRTVTPNAEGEAVEYRVATGDLAGDVRAVRFRFVASADDHEQPVDGTQEAYTATVMTAVPLLEGREGYQSGGEVVGAIEAWVDGRAADQVQQQSPGTLAPSSVWGPDDAKSPKNLTVTIHYHRGDGDYQSLDRESGRWTGWDIWSWATDSFNGAVSFTGQDDFGMVATYEFTQDTEGVRAPNFIVRGGGSSWSAKDPADGELASPDRPIPESLITVDGVDHGSAEFWVVSGDLNLYAYPVSVVGVTFEDCDGAGECVVLGSQSVRAGATASVPAAPTGDGHRTFLHWSATRSGGAFDFGTPITGRTRLYAQWADPVQVTFEYGNGVERAVVEVARGGRVERPADPVREGWRFLGWALGGSGGLGGSDGDASGLFDFDGTTVNGDCTLVAQWERIEYEVTFDAAGGAFVAAAGSDGGSSGGTVADGTVRTVAVAHGEAVSLPTEPERPGHRFLGWAVADGSGAAAAPYLVGAPVTDDLALLAQWADAGLEVHTVTFKDGADSASGGPAGDGQVLLGTTVVDGQSVAEPQPRPQRADMLFVGWAVQSGSAGAEGSGQSSADSYDFARPVTGDLVLVAQWRPGHTVTFDVGEGTPLDASVVEVAEGSRVARPDYDPVPSEPTGLWFDGWVVRGADGLSDPYDFAQPVTQDLTLAASWRQGPRWTIRFDLNGGNALDGAGDAFAEQHVFDGDRLRIPSVDGQVVEPHCEGCVFQGWTTVKNDALAASVVRFDADGNSRMPITRDGVLYALWGAPARVPEASGGAGGVGGTGGQSGGEGSDPDGGSGSAASAASGGGAGSGGAVSGGTGSGGMVSSEDAGATSGDAGIDGMASDENAGAAGATASNAKAARPALAKFPSTSFGSVDSLPVVVRPRC